MSKPPPRVTALDVARAAGVSRTTVSYVLNATPKQTFPEETRRRVLDAVRTLNYTPSSAARALRRGRHDTVLLVMPDWPLGRTIAEILNALTTALESRGLALMIRRLRPGRPLTTIWRELEPAAVISLGNIDESEQEELRRAGIFVASAVLTASSSSQSVVIPQERIGAMQAQHLAARGHRHLGYASPHDQQFHAFRNPRVEGARLACLELELDGPVVAEFELDVEAATAAVHNLTDRQIHVTGIIAYNDHFAGAVLAAARELGLSVPRDLAVIGVDNEPLGRFTSPAITTVDQNPDVVANRLSQLIFSDLLDEPFPESPCPETLTLLIRESA